MNARRFSLLAMVAFGALAAGPGAAAQSVRAGIEAWQRCDYAKAVAIWTPLAEKGDADAAFNLGQAYRLGRGVSVDLARAQKWLDQAARANHLDAQVTLGLLLAAKLVRNEPDRAFGEAMMFVYYGCAFPLSMRIARGFYGDGIWSDTGFMRWSQISALSWKEERGVTLILISHFRNIARRLQVPAHLYGQARRVLQDKVREHALRMGGSGLDLGSRDEGDVV